MPLLSVENLSKRFPAGAGRMLHAVSDVSFAIEAGGSLGLVGESGSGKSTLVRLVTRLLAADAGSIAFEGRDIAAIPPQQFARDPARRAMQMVFQSAEDALNPAFSTARNIAVTASPAWRRAETEARVAAVAAEVGFPAELLSRRPSQLSGGQQARAGIARALLPDPRLIALDEPTASLDVSVQATVLKLIDRLRRERGIALLFVSHDLDVVRLMCDRVLVLYLGRVAEYAPVAQVMSAAAHPYSRALVAARPGKAPSSAPLTGEPLSPIDPPDNACLFHSRCPLAVDRCRVERPALRELASGWQVACHRAEEVRAQYVSEFAAC
jgi:oligopeptide/dipeptide ABC transporter ATP-binding protein